MLKWGFLDSVVTLRKGDEEAVRAAISILDDTYERTSQPARDLGISRWEFFSGAADGYLEGRDSESVAPDR